MRRIFFYISSLSLRTFIIAPIVLAILFAWMILMANGRIFGIEPGFRTVYAQTGWSYVTLSPYYLLPGQSFTIHGNGFMPGENVFLSTSFGTSITSVADVAGRFVSQALTVPADLSSSSVNISARGDNGSFGTATLSVGGFYPVVHPSSYYIVRGNSVRFSGSDFYPSESVAIYRNGTRLGTSVADVHGGFESDWFRVGYISGQQTYSFVGQTSGVSISRSINVSNAPPYILLGNYYNYPGSSVSVTGRAFGSGEQVTVRFGGNVLGTATTSGSGEFLFTGVVPQIATPGTHPIVAHGSATGMQARSVFTVAPLFLRTFGLSFGK